MVHPHWVMNASSFRFYLLVCPRSSGPLWPFMSAFLAFDDSRGLYQLFRSVGERTITEIDFLITYLCAPVSYFREISFLTANVVGTLIVAGNKFRDCDGDDDFSKVTLKLSLSLLFFPLFSIKSLQSFDTGTDCKDFRRIIYISKYFSSLFFCVSINDTWIIDNWKK